MEIRSQRFRRAHSLKRSNPPSPFISARSAKCTFHTTTQRRVEFNQGNPSNAERIRKLSDLSSTAGVRSVQEER